MRKAKILATAIGMGLAAGPVAAQDKFNVEEAAATCAACHGEQGIPIQTDYPIIWGQQFYYLYVQLKDFKAGRRASDIMQPMAEQFDKDQMKALAQYFADKPWPRIPANADPVDAGRIEKLISDGQCAGCHNTFKGDSRIPRVAGQQTDYIHKTLMDLKTGVRNNAAAMQSLMHVFSEDDIAVLAKYLGSL